MISVFFFFKASLISVTYQLYSTVSCYNLIGFTALHFHNLDTLIQFAVSFGRSASIELCVLWNIYITLQFLNERSVKLGFEHELKQFLTNNFQPKKKKKLEEDGKDGSILRAR